MHLYTHILSTFIQATNIENTKPKTTIPKYPEATSRVCIQGQYHSTKLKIEYIIYPNHHPYTRITQVSIPTWMVPSSLPCFTFQSHSLFLFSRFPSPASTFFSHSFLFLDPFSFSLMPSSLFLPKNQTLIPKYLLSL